MILPNKIHAYVESCITIMTDLTKYWTEDECMNESCITLMTDLTKDWTEDECMNESCITIMTDLTKHWKVAYVHESFK